MRADSNIETEVWRLLLLRRNGSELFALESESGLLLPSVHLPARSRPAAKLNEQVKGIWNFECVSLCPLWADSSFTQMSPRYYVAEIPDCDAGQASLGRWSILADLTERKFAEHRDWAAVHEWQQRSGGKPSDESTIPFALPGSFLRIREWVQESLEPYGRKLTGPFVQLSAGQSFSLIRFDTDAGAVWFKAVGEPNQREFPLTIFVCEHFPLFTPQLLATHPRWKAWLTWEVPGSPLSESYHASDWSNAARDIATFQIDSIHVLDRFRLFGSRDVGLSNLASLINPFFECISGLMELQTKTTPPRLAAPELAELGEAIAEAIHRLGQAGLPDTLGHLDLNPENIFPLADRTVFIDWAETSVGYPFFSFAHLLEHWRSLFGDLSEGQDEIASVYLNIWANYCSVPDPKKILGLALLLAVFAHAVSTDSWRDRNALEDPRMAGYYRSLARRMKSYWARLRNGASCVSEIFC